MNKVVRVSVDGCDDSTTFEMTVSDLELKFLTRLAAKTHEVSNYGCMPTIEIKELGN